MFRKTIQTTLDTLRQRTSQSEVFMHWLKRKYPIQIVRTQAEKDAVARFWYRTMIEEQNRAVPFADHERRRIWTDEDDHPSAIHCYVTDREGIVAALRLRVWMPGEIPQQEVEYYSLDRVEGIDERRVCDIHRFVVRPTSRGTLVAIALSAQAVFHSVSEYGVEVALADCAPGLIHHWKRFGLRPYGARLVCTYHGITVPMMAITNDLDHYRAVGSPWLQVGPELIRRGLLPTVNLDHYQPLFETDDTVVADQALIQSELRALVDDEGAEGLHGLPGRIVEWIGRHGLILNVEAGQQLTRAGVVDRDIYVVLSGELTAYKDGASVASMGQGSLFGEVAMFSSDGRRVADVVAQRGCRLFVLRSRFLRRLMRQAPEDAFLVYERLSQLMANRLASRGRAFEGSDAGASALFEVGRAAA